MIAYSLEIFRDIILYKYVRYARLCPLLMSTIVIFCYCTGQLAILTARSLLWFIRSIIGYLLSPNIPNNQFYFGDLQETYESFNLAHNKVFALIDTDNFDEQDAIRSDIEKAFYRTKFYYNQIFPPKEAPTVQPVTNNIQHNLPKIKLINFNGQTQDWESFIGLFNSLVHNNASLSEVEKFHYLLTSVTGPALDIIKTLPLQADNYSVAYNILYNRFNNRRRLATQYYNKIFEGILYY